MKLFLKDVRWWLFIRWDGFMETIDPSRSARQYMQHLKRHPEHEQELAKAIHTLALQQEKAREQRG